MERVKGKRARSSGNYLQDSPEYELSSKGHTNKRDALLSAQCRIRMQMVKRKILKTPMIRKIALIFASSIVLVLTIRGSSKYSSSNNMRHNFGPSTHQPQHHKRQLSSLAGHIQTQRIRRDMSGQEILQVAGYGFKPITMGYYFSGIDSSTFQGAQRLDHLQRRMTKNIIIDGDKEERKSMNSKDYRNGKASQWEEDDCKAQYEWQKKSFPTCNKLHENDLTDLHAETRSDEHVRLLANGYWRDVWLYDYAPQDQVVVKTIRYEHDFEERNYDRHRRDAVAMEHLTSSNHVVDIYAYCGNSGVFQFAPDGDMYYSLWDKKDTKWTIQEKLIVAYHVAVGIGDMHNVDKEGVPSMVHSDITLSQFILIDGIYKLNDFNRVRFLTYNKKKGELCGFRVGNNPGTVSLELQSG